MAAQKQSQQLTREHAHGILDDILPQFKGKEFQRRLRELWESTPDPLEKIRLRQELCLQIQGPAISKYGYNATAAGVAKSSSQIVKLMPTDQQLAIKGALNQWLVTHLEYIERPVDLEERNLDEYFLTLTRTGYKVSLTRPEDADAIRGMERCRNVMVEAHQALYEPFYPGIRPNEWLDVLGSDTIKKSLESGIVMMHAESLETGEVVGYISCTEGADLAEYVGSWSCSADPSLSFQILQHEDGQLRVDGVFSPGASSGSGVLAGLGKWLEAKIVSSADGRRSGIAGFCIAGPGGMLVRFKPLGETDFHRDMLASRVSVAGPGQDAGPHTKINHVVVLPGHNNRRVARLLFEELLTYLGKGPATSDLRLSVVERNLHAISWYFKLGFSIVEQQLAHMSTLKHGHVHLVFLEMQRRRGAMAPLHSRMFGREVCGEKVVLIPECAPLAFHRVVRSGCFRVPGVAVRAFDQTSGLHRLEDGRSVDLSQAYSRGLLLFEQPLHLALAVGARAGAC